MRSVGVHNTKEHRLLPGKTTLTGSLATGPPPSPVSSRPTTSSEEQSGSEQLEELPRS